MRGPRVARAERAALVGLIAGRARRLEAERSLDELAGLAEAAGAQVVLRVLQERPKPDPSTFLGAGKIATLAASCAETNVDVVIFDNELTPGAAAADRGEGRPQDHRSHAAHSRHLRAARADARRQAAGRARAAEIPAAAARRRGRRAVAARRRHRHQGPRRNQARNRPPAHPHAHSRGHRRHRAGAAPPRAAARAAPQGVGADRRARRLHQRRKDDAVQPADAGGRGGVRTRCS